MHEKKVVFFNVCFFNPLFDNVQKANSARYTEAFKHIDLRRNSIKLKEIHQAVLVEIEQLAKFCKTCKPARKNKIF